MLTSDRVEYTSGGPRRLGLSYETTAVKAIDLAAARVALAALRMLIACGSRPGWNVRPAAFAASLEAAFGVLCACWALLLAAMNTDSASTIARHSNFLWIIAASLIQPVLAAPRRRSRDHAALKHFVCNWSGDLVDEHGAHLRVVAQQLHC